MASKQPANHPRAGDLIETRGIHGRPARRGEIVELLGGEGHKHYRVRWDEQHESIVYPADGVVIIPRRQRTRKVGS
jgi:hypothetical protein